MTSSSSTPSVKFPTKLDSVIRVNVERPKRTRSKEEKEAEEEVLVVEAELQRKDVYVKFDVYVNDEDEDDNEVSYSKKMQVKAEYAGSFVHVPHKPRCDGDDEQSLKMKTILRLGLTDLIEDLGADDDDGVVITLVPKCGNEVIFIEDVKIELSS